MRFGVEFSDGQKATTLDDILNRDMTEEPPGPVLIQGGASFGGEDFGWEGDFWLWPLPPPGPLALVVEWPSEDIELTRHEIDAGLFLDAAAKSEVLWPAYAEDGD